MSHGLYKCPYNVSGSGNISAVLLSTDGQKAHGFHQKYLNLCSNDGTKGVINHRIFIFG